MNKLISFYIVIILAIFYSGEAQAEEKGIFLGYEGGSGPMDWEDLASFLTMDLYLCREGTHQSPIDINKALERKPQNLVSDYSPTPIRILNNGHTIHLSYNSGSTVNWKNKIYNLIQFHFHSPSEHTINGKHYDMEMHLVHKTQDHQFLVIGILIKKGMHNPNIQKIWDRIPTMKNKEVYFQNDLLNVDNLLPPEKEYFYYSGSLTTPPCLENVNWFILKTPIEVSGDQILFFQKYIKNNARPTQNLNNRIIATVK